MEQLVPHWVLNVLPASLVHLQVLRVPCRKNHSDFPTLISGLVDRYVQRGRFRNDKVGRSYYFLVPVPGNLFVGCSVGPEWTGSMDCQKLVRFSRGWGFEVGLNFEERWQGQAVCQRLSAFVSVCQRLSVVTLLFQYLLARTSQLNDNAEGNMLRLGNFC